MKSLETLNGIVLKAGELLKSTPFFGEMRRILYDMREAEPEEPDEETKDDFLAAMDGVPNVPVRVERRRQERVRHGEKLTT